MFKIDDVIIAVILGATCQPAILVVVRKGLAHRQMETRKALAHLAHQPLKPRSPPQTTS
jgi:hypothetical protein